MKTIHFDATRDSLDEVIDGLFAKDNVAVITRGGAPDLVVMPRAHYDGLIATLELLGTPANAAHLAHSIAQLHAGQVVQRYLIEPDDEGSQIDAQVGVHR